MAFRREPCIEAFAVQGQTFAGVLMRMRVDETTRMLCDRRFDRLTIAEVARRCGFLDPHGPCRQAPRRDGNRIVIAGRESAQETVNQVGQEITKRNMSIQPTLTIRPGFPMRVMVSKDLVLRAISAAVLPAGSVAMSKSASRLSLGALPRAEVVKLTITVPAELKLQLDAYAEVHSRLHGPVDAVGLIPRTCCRPSSRAVGVSRRR